MRILQFLQGRCNPDSANGVEKTVYFAARRQAELNHDVVLVQQTSKPAIAIPGVEIYNVDGSVAQIIESICGLLDELAPDIAHLHSAFVPFNLAAAFACVRRSIPYVVTPNGVLSAPVMRRRPVRKWLWRYTAERWIHRHAALIHSVGDSDSYSDIAGSTPTVVIPNGVEGPRGGSRYFGGTPKGQITFGFLGRLDVEQKGLDVLLDGWDLFYSGNGSLVSPVEVSLIIVGPDWKGSRAKLQSQLLDGKTPSVELKGPLFGDDKWRFLLSLDFFVAPSRWEGLPFAVLEAMSAGVPPIVTPAADPLGRVAGEHCGFRVPSGDAVALARALRDATVLDSHERRAMSQRCMNLVAAEFSWDEVGNRLVDAYASVRGVR